MAKSGGGLLVGRVNAVADGALLIKTNKAKDKTKYGIWSKHRCALSFEVIFISFVSLMVG